MAGIKYKFPSRFAVEGNLFYQGSIPTIDIVWLNQVRILRYACIMINPYPLPI